MTLEFLATIKLTHTTYTSLQIIFVSKQVICLTRDKFFKRQEASLVGQNMFFHHMFTSTGIVVQQ